MTPITLRIFQDTDALSRYAAELLAQSVHAAVSARGVFRTALSGGGTPAGLYRLMAQPPYRASLPWERMHFFWGDERCVLPDDPESCYNQARVAWLAHVPVPQANIFRVRGELGPQAAAEDYAHRLKYAAQDGLDWPRFDFVLLGMGADGHTASLFPGSLETSGQATVAVTAQYQDRPSQRVSLTPDVFNAARQVVFLVTGLEKAGALTASLAGPRQPLELPVQRIRPTDGQVFWLVDAAAASLLPEQIEDVSIQRE